MKLERNHFINANLPGGFRVEHFLGMGAFAWVYRGKSPEGRTVAIKIQHNNEGDAYKRFMREIKVLKALKPSPHRVGYFGDGVTPEGLPFLVMEFVDGHTLKRLLKQKPVWNERDACKIMIQLADAFGDLHALGLVHRDVKPENIMITKKFEVKLMDFGLVKDAQGLLNLFESEDILEGKDFAENIDRGILAGTPEYMAPEQLSDPKVASEDKAQTDTWSDVYSLGLIFYELLTGKRLFPLQGKAKTRAEHARLLLNYIQIRTTFDDKNLQRPPEINFELWTIIEMALRQDPRQRPRDAREFHKYIQHYMETGEGIFIEDEDHTIAKNLDEIDLSQLQEFENFKQNLEEDGFDEEDHTIPINRDQLQHMMQEHIQSLDQKPNTPNWQQQASVVQPQTVQYQNTSNPNLARISMPIHAAVPPQNAQPSVWIWVAIGGVIGLLILIILILLIP